MLLSFPRRQEFIQYLTFLSYVMTFILTYLVSLAVVQVVMIHEHQYLAIISVVGLIPAYAYFPCEQVSAGNKYKKRFIRDGNGVPDDGR